MKDVITIDGPSGSGKSTVSMLLAGRLGYQYLDTGALYRAIAWQVKEENVNPEDEKKLGEILKKTTITLRGGRIMVNGTDVTSQIRNPEIGEISSHVSAKPVVRQHLYTIQRQSGLKGKVVIEGRDIGTAIFPEAENKFFLDASLEERGRRRYKELKDPVPFGTGEHKTPRKASPQGKQDRDKKRHKGLEISLKEITEDIKKRDRRDSTRQKSPLKRTEDMIYIDTSNLTVQEVVTKIITILNKHISGTKAQSNKDRMKQ